MENLTGDERLLVVACLKLAIADRTAALSNVDEIVLAAEDQSDQAREQIEEVVDNIDVLRLLQKLV